MQQKIRFGVRFYVDHEERELPTPTDVGKSRSQVTVLSDDPHLGELLSDAEYYASTWGPDLCPPGIIASAKATVRAIRDVIGWDDADDDIKRLRRTAR